MKNRFLLGIRGTNHNFNNAVFPSLQFDKFGFSPEAGVLFVYGALSKTGD